MLSCSCYDDDECAWYYNSLEKFIPLATKHNRRRRCCSCHKPIDIGASVVRIDRWRPPRDEIELRIARHDDAEIPLAAWFLCEECGEIFLNLNAIGYCIDVSESMQDLLKEYHEMTGWKPKEK